MKLIILKALKEWILKYSDEEKWKEIARFSGLNPEHFREQDNFLSKDRFEMLNERIMKTLGIEEADMNEKFIHFWMTDYAPKIYHFLIKGSKNVKQFVLGVFQLNNDICSLYPNRHISKIDIQQIDNKTITAIYPNEKSLVDIIAVLRGSSHFFTDKFAIKKINSNSVSINFDQSENI